MPKFVVSNEFIYRGERVKPGTVVEVKGKDVDTLKAKRVLGKPVREALDKAVATPEEERIILPE